MGAEDEYFWLIYVPYLKLKGNHLRDLPALQNIIKNVNSVTIAILLRYHSYWCTNNVVLWVCFIMEFNWRITRVWIVFQPTICHCYVPLVSLLCHYIVVMSLRYLMVSWCNRAVMYVWMCVDTAMLLWCICICGITTLSSSCLSGKQWIFMWWVCNVFLVLLVS